MGKDRRAADTKLNRDVAIKILPEAFAADANRMARFTREAQALAALNHRDIATIYGVEEHALAIELVGGRNASRPPVGSENSLLTFVARLSPCIRLLEMLFSLLPHMRREEIRMSISQTLLPEFDQEMTNTRKLLERFPEGKNDYKPHPKSMALGRLAGHVAELPGWAKSTLEVEVLEIQPDFQPTIATSRQQLLEIFDRNVAQARPLIERATDADWAKNWTLKFGGKEIFSMPRAVVMRNVVMNHLIHHRAQLGVYLRLNEVEIPGMYGPSADEPRFFEPAKAG
jgi:uncharacterized damage-inducible protein DinB